LRALVPAALAVLLLAPATPAQQVQVPVPVPDRIPNPDHVPQDGTYQGRFIAQVMSYLGADWLVRDSRVAEEQPDKMLAALEIQKGMTVADVGAGVGYHSLKLARLVGPSGTVYATDIQPQMIRMLKSRLAASKLRNVKPVLCTQDDPKLPEGAVDLILMVDVYHEMSNPEPSMKALKRALKPGGRLVLVEFRGEDPEVPIKPEHKMTVAQVRKEIEPLGFRLAVKHDFLPWQHILVFEKPADAAEGTPAPGPAEGAAQPAPAAPSE
jgi:ubiquinone/menaquinone biosynthesis C-methylase UbiE